jgi:hypothetical protein
MPSNPLFDTNWQTRLASAEAALAAARQDEAAKAASFASPAHRAAMAALDAAKDEQRAAWRAQFETVADYAGWRFTEMTAARDGFALAYEPSSFTSIEEVDAAHAHALRDEREGTLEQRFRLETGQPAGLAAFAEASQTISSWRRFGEIDCMVSFCMGEELFHICLAHPWGGLALKSNDIFRAIATQLARESLILQEPEAERLFHNDGHRLLQNRELIRHVNALAAHFRFYRHLLPERGLREEFCRVDMVWNGAGWIDPEWSAMVYAKVPAVLRDAAGQPALPALPSTHFPLR